MSTLSDQTISELCSYHPLALPVLRRTGVALAPAASLDETCRTAGIEPDAVRAAVRDAEERLTAPWRDLPVGEVIDHIVRSYHRPLLRALADIVDALASAPAAWSEVRRALEELGVDMEQHLAMEEHVLFPWLRAPASTPGAPIRAMQLEHADTIRFLLSLSIPAAPGALRARVLAVESWLCEHLHFEGNELIPRALAVG